MDNTAWKVRHEAAIANPTGFEAGMLKMIEGADVYCKTYYARYEGVIGDDRILGDEGIKVILEGLRTLLNGELGRLDGGTLDRKITGLAQTYGVILE